MEFWTIDEFQKFYSHLEQSKVSDQLFATAIYVLFFTGLRIGELLALQWKDIDWEKKNLRVRQNLVIRREKSFGDMQYFLSTPKTKSSLRTIGLDDKTIDILMKWKKRQERDVFSSENYIFQVNGDFVSDAWFRLRMKKNCRECGIKRIKIHSLRHSHASYLIYLGVDILHIQKRLGHQNVKTTLSLYGHLYPNYENDLMQMLNSKNNF